MDVLSSRLRATLRDLTADPSEFAADLARATPDDMRPFGYPYYYVNLLSVFGRLMPLAAVESLALACTRHKLWTAWSYCRYWADMSHGVTPHTAVRLHGWQRHVIADLLSAGHGLIVMTSHFGDFRSVPSDLAVLGFNVTVAVDASTWRDSTALLHKYPVTLPGRLRYINVETVAHASLQLLATLRRNEIVTIVVDGNTGADGKWGTSNRMRFDFLGRSVCVKSGAGLLAATASAPLLPVMVCKDAEGSHHVFLGNPVLPPAAGSSHDTAETPIANYYRWLESWVRRHPEQWEGAHLLHRSRYAEALGIGQPDANGGAALPAGTRLHLDPARVAVLPCGASLDLVDTDTLRVWRVADTAGPVIRRLASEAGILVDAGGLLDADGGAERLLRRLHGAGAIEARVLAGAA